MTGTKNFGMLIQRIYITVVTCTNMNTVQISDDGLLNYKRQTKVQAQTKSFSLLYASVCGPIHSYVSLHLASRDPDEEMLQASIYFLEVLVGQFVHEVYSFLNLF